MRCVLAQDIGYTSPDSEETPTLLLEMRLADSGPYCIVDSGSEMNIIGRRHLRKLHRASIPFTTSPLREPFIVAGAIETESLYAYETFPIHALHLKPSEGFMEFRCVDFYLLEDADDMILGLPLLTPPATILTTTSLITGSGSRASTYR